MFIAFSKSPPASSSALRHSRMPTPVAARSSLICSAEIGITNPRPRLRPRIPLLLRLASRQPQAGLLPRAAPRLPPMPLPLAGPALPATLLPRADLLFQPAPLAPPTPLPQPAPQPQEAPMPLPPQSPLLQPAWRPPPVLPTAHRRPGCEMVSSQASLRPTVLRPTAPALRRLPGPVPRRTPLPVLPSARPCLRRRHRRFSQPA